jgi:predicted solute-binding protein
MLNCDLIDASRLAHPKLRVCAVSYLNTVPLVWGLLHGDQQGIFELDFAIPAECADRLERGLADIGIVPAAELPRLGLKRIEGTGIACEGPVRSILLVSRVPLQDIQTLAADSSSRTSVMLARIVLARKYGCEPVVSSMAPDLAAMLESADAALIIGDPALHVDPSSVPFHVIDLGAEWTEMTGLPMVFAVWAGRPEIVSKDLAPVFRDSLRFGLDHLNEIIANEAAPHGVSQSLAREYLTGHIRFELGQREYEGMDLFLQYAAELGSLNPLGIASA